MYQQEPTVSDQEPAVVNEMARRPAVKVRPPVVHEMARRPAVLSRSQL